MRGPTCGSSADTRVVGVSLLYRTVELSTSSISGRVKVMNPPDAANPARSRDISKTLLCSGG